MSSAYSRGLASRIMPHFGDQVSFLLPLGEILAEHVLQVHVAELQLVAEWSARIAHIAASNSPEISPGSISGGTTQQVRSPPVVTWVFNDDEESFTNNYAELVRHHIQFQEALRFAHIWESYHGVRLTFPINATDEVSVRNFYLFSRDLRHHLNRLNIPTPTAHPTVLINQERRAEAIDRLLISVPIDETETESEPCPICAEMYCTAKEDGISHDACMLPDCKHVFGRACIRTWLKEENKSTCPMCRAKVEIEYQRLELRRDAAFQVGIPASTRTTFSGSN